MYQPDLRLLIVNADDFGLSPGVNRGVVHAHRRGIVTSASLMVRQPAAQQAANLARECPDLGLGLHIDLGEWVWRDNQWMPLYHVVDVEDSGAVAAEIDRQLAVFNRLTGNGPTHLDSHQHVHRRPAVHDAVSRAAARLGMPLRHEGAVRYVGEFYGQDDEGRSYHDRLTPGFLAWLIESLPDGVNELCCHPAAEVDFEGTYRRERVEELAALCSPIVQNAIIRRGIVLTSFAAVHRGDTVLRAKEA